MYISHVEDIIKGSSMLALGYGAEDSKKLQFLSYASGIYDAMCYPYFSLFLRNVSSPGGFKGDHVFTSKGFKVFAIIIGSFANQNLRFSNIRLITQIDIKELVLPAMRQQCNLSGNLVEVHEVFVSRE